MLRVLVQGAFAMPGQNPMDVAVAPAKLLPVAVLPVQDSLEFSLD
jgi:hypothetical protein